MRFVIREDLFPVLGDNSKENYDRPVECLMNRLMDGMLTIVGF